MKLQRGAAYLIVLIIITLLTISANYFFEITRTHAKSRKAHQAYSRSSQLAEATIDLANSWLAAQQTPPELSPSSTTTILGNNRTNGDLVKTISERDLAESSFYWFSYNQADGANNVGFVILPVGTVLIGSCASDYDPGCVRAHQYLIVARSRSSDKTMVEHVRNVTRTFF